MINSSLFTKSDNMGDSELLLDYWRTGLCKNAVSSSHYVAFNDRLIWWIWKAKEESICGSAW